MNDPIMDKNLIPITTDLFDVYLQLAYSTKDNFTGEVLYRSSICYLHKEAASRLKTVIGLLAPLHLKLKIWDGFRPLTIQKSLFQHLSDPDYVSSPEIGICPHCRGVAVDLTITDRFGKELDMGTDFDDFRPLAHHGNNQISIEAQKNRLLLAGSMSIAGFEPLDAEWWHYQLPNASEYPFIKSENLPPEFREENV